MTPPFVYVAVNFLSQVIFVFLLFLGIVMYAYEVGSTPQGGHFQKNWVGVFGKLSETVTLFPTKICDISDLRPAARRVTGARDKLLRYVHGWRKH